MWYCYTLECACNYCTIFFLFFIFLPYLVMLGAYSCFCSQGSFVETTLGAEDWSLVGCIQGKIPTCCALTLTPCTSFKWNSSSYFVYGKDVFIVARQSMCYIKWKANDLWVKLSVILTFGACIWITTHTLHLQNCFHFNSEKIELWIHSKISSHTDEEWHILKKKPGN